MSLRLDFAVKLFPFDALLELLLVLKPLVIIEESRPILDYGKFRVLSAAGDFGKIGSANYTLQQKDRKIVQISADGHPTGI